MFVQFSIYALKSQWKWGFVRKIEALQVEFSIYLRNLKKETFFKKTALEIFVSWLDVFKIIKQSMPITIKLARRIWHFID